MNLGAINHENTKPYIYPLSREKLCFNLKAARGDIKTCKLSYWDSKKGKCCRKTINMTCHLRDSQFDYFQAIVDFSNVACYIKYFFELECDQDKVWYTFYGTYKNEPDDGFFEFLYANENDLYDIPKWTETQIYYQIFPERFFNGNKHNDPMNVESWGSIPNRINFMGGDLKGIIEKISYLADLGITCLYLNPIFKSPSNHKYDTQDYFMIDPHFGTKDDLIELVNQCHDKGIKVVLDGVFNHCGYTFGPFEDVKENGENSEFKNWFYIKSFPLNTDVPNYECVGHYKYMPKLHHSNQKVRDFIVNVGEYWIRETGIDGWRLDVADEVDYTLLQIFRQKLKQKYPNIILIGETWGSAAKMLQGDQLDSAMNYIFKDALTGFIAKNSIGPSEFDSRINRMLALYSIPTNYSMYNLIDSHDTPRFLFECEGNKNKLKIAVALQMTFIGSPAIYYGDEIGLSGGNDPDCRGAMIWDNEKQDTDLLQWYKLLITIRKRYPVLSKGHFSSNVCDDSTGLYGFIRSIDGERIYVILNAGNNNENAVIPVVEQPKSEFSELLINKKLVSENLGNIHCYNGDLVEYASKLTINMPAYSIKIIINKTEEFK